MVAKNNILVRIIRIMKRIFWRPKPRQDYEKEFPCVAVRYLVFYDEGRFIVAVDSELDLDWETTTAYDSEANNDHATADTLNTAALLENRVGREWPRELIIKSKRLIGEAISRVLSGQHAHANVALKYADTFISQKSIEVSRYWTLRAGFLCCLGLASAGVCLVVNQGVCAALIGRTLHGLMLAGCLGGIGAFLAIVIRLGRNQVNSDAGLDLHVAEACAKLVAGFICGFLMALLIKAGFILTAFQTSQHFPLVILTFAMLAGMSARWVPSILSKVTTEVSETSDYSGKPKPENQTGERE